MQMTFKSAFILSIVVHSAILIPGIRLMPDHDKLIDKNSIMVDYVPEKEPEIELKKSPDVLRKTEQTPVIAPTVKTDTVSKKMPAVNAPIKSLKDVADALAVKQAKVMATQDYINYYQLIREKIRRQLKDKYRSYYSEGDVCLIFILRSDGSLVSVGADASISTRDRILIDTAIQSVKEASRFAPFPKAIDLKQMSFTLTVSFKRQ